MAESKEERSISERVTRLEAQRNLFAAIAGLSVVGLVGGAVNVTLLTTRLDERYAAEHAATASIRAQVETLSQSVGNLGRFDERLTAMNASVTRIETETQRVRESVDQLRSDVLRTQGRRIAEAPRAEATHNAVSLRDSRRNSL